MNIHRKDRAKLKQPAMTQGRFPFNLSAKVTPPLMGYAPQLVPRPQQPALFVEKGPSRGDGRSSSSLGPAVEELDLELRLGPERPESHASSVGLRQFL